MLRRSAILLLVLASSTLLEAQAPAATVVWTQPNATPAEAIALRYTLILDTTTRLALQVPTCAIVNGATECRALTPLPVPCKQTAVLEAANAFAASTAPPVICGAPAAPGGFRILLLVPVTTP